MPDLLLEIFCEEIPARMQRRAADDLRRLVTDGLVDAGLTYEGARAFVTPRRLALTVHGLPARSPDRRDEKKGPRVGAPDKAISGFLRAAGLTSIDEAKVQPDKKGDFYIAVIETPGRAASDVIAELVPTVIRDFPWPKSMRWGAQSKTSGSLAWVRPIHSILCTFGPETEEPEVVDFTIDGIKSGNVTYGHRFMAPAPIEVRRLDDYASKLEAAKVVLDTDRRKDLILHEARDRTLALGLDLVEDDALADEVSGLVEWPVVLVGSFEPSFLELPPEVIRTTIRANQKCFVLRKAGSAVLAPNFVLVANIEASDGGKAIVAGNERVIRARLADAEHFWKTDLAALPDNRDTSLKPLDQRLAKLKAQEIVFHEKLGSQGERVGRIARLAKEIAPLVGADPEKVERAAYLAKADLVTEMVGEFPELQGLMGKYYALAQGEEPSVAEAIEDHYKPLGPSDRVPDDPVAIAVALADKLDMLVGFWAIDEKPTGSKDPYALRRAALGVIRLVLERELRIPLRQIFVHSGKLHMLQHAGLEFEENLEAIAEVIALDPEEKKIESILDTLSAHVVAELDQFRPRLVSAIDDLANSFFADRLKVQLREQGARHDLVDAVFALGRQDDLLLIVRRVEALGKFLDSEDGANLLVGYRRAANILRDEEKKSGEKFDGAVDASLLSEPQESALAEAIDVALPAATKAIEGEDFEAAMAALADLRAPVDAFFDAVMVNDPDANVRANRLRLLNRIREATLAVADFSKITG